MNAKVLFIGSQHHRAVGGDFPRYRWRGCTPGLGATYPGCSGATEGAQSTAPHERRLSPPPTLEWKQRRPGNRLTQLIRFALPFIHLHSGATGVFWPNCRVVYFQDDRREWQDRRSQAERWDLLMKISAHCSLLCLVFLVLGRSSSASQ